MNNFIAKRRLLFVLVATILGSSVALLDGTIVNLALPKIGAQLHVGFSALQWIVDGYMLALSSLILLGGSLGDIFGRKRVYLLGLLGFGVGSLLCALSPNAVLLVVFRIVQGVFGALLVPGGLSVINTNFGRAERGQAIGRWTAWLSISMILGPLVGGIILDVASWRWIFLINVPLVALCFMAAMPSITESRDARVRHVDIPGAGMALVSLAGLTYGLIQGPADHWRALPITGLIIGAAAGLYFLFIESRSRDPMVPLQLFRSRNFSGSNIMTFGMYGALSGFLVSLVIYMQQRIGYSSLQTGLSTLPISILMFFFAGQTGKLASRYGARLFMTAGPIITGIGVASLYGLHHGSSYIFGVMPGVLLFGIGLVLTVAPLTTTVMMAVDEKDSGIASGINNAVSRAAGLIVVAVLGLLGVGHVYHFSIVLCAGLAIGAGVISYLFIERLPGR
ncbi:MAG TPA: MFS transporter [Candidatus Saccharimonadales bacterium]|nr:MFS transporter [Candidatus Saccharimonadales bacterium]